MIWNPGVFRSVWNLLAAGVLVLAFSGCFGGSEAEVPKLAPVQGTIKLDGEPVEGVTVTFLPASGTTGTGGAGTTGADGRYTLMHRSGAEGVEPGAYTVTFSKFRMPDGSPIPEGATSADTDAREFLSQRARAAKEATVPEGGATLDFNLSS